MSLPARMKTLYSGAVMPEDDFGKLLGGGWNRAMRHQRKLEVPGYGTLIYSYEKRELEEMLFDAVTDNNRLRAAEEARAEAIEPKTIDLKPRYRVKAVSVPTPLLAPPAEPTHVEPVADRKSLWDGYDPDIQAELRRFPTRINRGRHVFDHSALSPAQAKELKAIQARQHMRRYRNKDSK